MSGEAVACLVRIHSKDKVRSHIIARPNFIIGRSKEADVSIASSSISRQHLRVEISESAITVTDLGSANGTRLSGTALAPEKAVKLGPGQKLSLGTMDEEISFEVLPCPIELLNSEDQRKQLADQLADLEKHYKAQLDAKMNEELDKLHQSARRQWEKDIVIKRANAEAELQKMIEATQARLEEERSQKLKDVLQEKSQLEEEIAILRKQAQTILADARIEAERQKDQIIKESQNKAQQELNETLEKINLQAKEEYERAANVIKKAQQEAEDILKSARLEGQSIRAQAQDETRTALAKTLEETKALREKTRKEVLAIREEAQQEALQVREATQRESTEALTAYKKEMDALKALAEAERKIIMKKAEEDAEEALQSAQQKAEKVLAQAEKKSNELLSTAEERANQQILALTQHHRVETAKKREEFDREIQDLRTTSLAKIREEVQAENEKTIALYRETLEKLRAQKKDIEQELSDARGDVASLKSQKENLDFEISGLQKRLAEDKKSYLEIHDKLESAHQLLAKAEVAEKSTIELEARREKAQNDLEIYTKKYQDGMAQIDSDFQAKKSSLQVQFENEKKQIQDEVTKKRLETFAVLKSQIEVEEKRYHETLQMRAGEVINSLQRKLLPDIKTVIEKHVPNEAHGISMEINRDCAALIESTVRDVLLKNAPELTAITEHLTANPEKAAKNKKRLRTGAYAAGAVAIIAVAVFWGPILSYFKGLGNYSDVVVEKRKIESIYTPVQTDEWRENYTDNILHLRNYYDAKIDPMYKEQWTLRLNNLELLRTLGLNEDDVVQFLGKEAAMIQRLGALRESIDARFLDQGLQRMREAEGEDVHAMIAMLKGEANWRSIKSLEKDFTQQYLKRNFGIDPNNIELNSPLPRQPAQGF